ncbi:MAG: YopT-type cysteine protease domain-containing protein [Isosphaeraceae bacterium]
MAKSKHFQKLKDHATKDWKFKQGISIQACYKSWILSPETYSKIERGVCAALTLEWLQGKLNWTGLGSFDLLKSSSIDERNEMLVESVAKRQIKANKYASAEKGRKLCEALGKQLNLKVLDNEEYQKDKKFKDHFVYAHGDKDLHSKGLMIIYHLSEVAAHAVGACRLDSGFHFFDANLGAYVVKDPEKFAEEYVQRYADSPQGKWVIDTAYCVQLEPIDNLFI